MNIETVYNSMMKTASFTNFGAGRRGNDLLVPLQQLSREAPNLFPGYSDQARSNDEAMVKGIKEELGNSIISPANRDAALIGTAAGLGTAGLTYTALDQIPALRKKRLKKAIIAAMAGIPAGVLVGDRAGNWAADHRMVQGLVNMNNLAMANPDFALSKLEGIGERISKYLPGAKK